ncbi:MAG: hypothetical protein HKN81_05340 [Gammaproteobacteria bacterium]|nr:hypothetical protein [Gammaproteobacteria bacterium]
MNDFLVSLIRTWVPIVVGSVAAMIGVDVDAAAITGAVIAVYYAAVRFLELRYPRIGVLLGRTQQPTY